MDDSTMSAKIFDANPGRKKQNLRTKTSMAGTGHQYTWNNKSVEYRKATEGGKGHSLLNS